MPEKKKANIVSGFILLAFCLVTMLVINVVLCVCVVVSVIIGLILNMIIMGKSQPMFKERANGIGCKGY